MQLPEPVLLPFEKDAVLLTIGFADRYGYGNLIAQARLRWAIRLMKDFPELSWKEALAGADSASYPMNLPGFEDVP